PRSRVPEAAGRGRPGGRTALARAGRGQFRWPARLREHRYRQAASRAQVFGGPAGNHGEGRCQRFSRWRLRSHEHPERRHGRAHPRVQQHQRPSAGRLDERCLPHPAGRVTPDPQLVAEASRQTGSTATGTFTAVRVKGYGTEAADTWVTTDPRPEHEGSVYRSLRLQPAPAPFAELSPNMEFLLAGQSVTPADVAHWLDADTKQAAKLFKEMQRIYGPKPTMVDLGLFSCATELAPMGASMETCRPEILSVSTTSEGQAHDAALLGQSLQDALANPPHGVRDELEALRLIEALGRFNQPQVALVDEVAQGQALVLVLIQGLAFAVGNLFADFKLSHAVTLLLILVSEWGRTHPWHLALRPGLMGIKMLAGGKVHGEGQSPVPASNCRCRPLASKSMVRGRPPQAFVVGITRPVPSGP
nr:hypothetical protein [Tanacetum cinerariifolium]